MDELKCPNGYTDYETFKSKFIIDDHEGETCLHCRALYMCNDGLIVCSKYNKEDNYDN